MLNSAVALFGDVVRTLPSHSIWHESRIGAFLSGVATEGMVRPLPKKHKRDKHDSSRKRRPHPHPHFHPFFLSITVEEMDGERGGDSLAPHRDSPSEGGSRWLRRPHGSWLDSGKTIKQQKQQKHTEKDTWIHFYAQYMEDKIVVHN